MKPGTVKFYKTVIISVLVLLILIPLALSVWFGVLYYNAKSKVEELEAVNKVIVNEFVGALPQISDSGSGSGPTPHAENEAPYSPLSTYALPPSFEYQLLYPHLYAKRAEKLVAEDKMCYLTFDDGPSSVTEQILDTLKEYDIKATFFVTGRASEMNSEILKRAFDEGHTIGVHTYSHDYPKIYNSVEAYLEDFDKIFRLIQDITGEAPQVFRFAGGSINAYNQKHYPEIVAEMLRRGFLFFDWNSAGNDAVVGGITHTEVTRNVLKSAVGDDRIIVLLHDRTDNSSTAQALPGIIDGLKTMGFSFARIENYVEPITYYYTGN